MKYAFIRSQRNRHRLRHLCQVLGVSVSGYYAWCDRPLSRRARDNQRLKTRIRCFYQASRGIYGSPRIHRDLLDSGEHVSRQRVARLMRSEGIQSRVARKFVMTTDSKNTHAPAPDRLRRQFISRHPNQAWVSDTTFIRTRQGWLYLAVVLDLYSRQVIGWAMGDKNNADIVVNALTMAVWRRGDKRGVVVHSDRGSTYASSRYCQLLDRHQLVASMSRKGDCYDNAVAESFFGSLKNEWVDHDDYRSKEQAKSSLFEYIEIFYNRQRRHSYLGYVSPVEYERGAVP